MWLLVAVQYVPLLFSASGNALVAVASVMGFGAACFINKQNLRIALSLLKLMGFALALLFLLYGVEIAPLELRDSWLYDASRPALRLIGVFSLMFCLINAVRRRELYSFLLAMEIPVPWIFVCFRAFWFVPEMRRRSADIVLSQRLRGVPIRGSIGKFKALVASFTALFNSMVLEIEDSSIALASKGITLTGLKTPLYEVRWTTKDTLVLLLVSASVHTAAWAF